MVNSAAINIGLQVSFGIPVFFRYESRSEIAGYMVIIFLVFKELPYCSPEWLYQFTCSQTVQEGSLSSKHSPKIIICRIFLDGYSDWYEVTPHCISYVNFSNN